MTVAKRTLTIGLILPDVLGTYGDDGNALVLRQRARHRGIDAQIRRVLLTDDIPADCDIYTLGGGEDAAQLIAAARLAASPGLQAAAAAERPIFAVCAGMQVLGRTFYAHGTEAQGISLIDVSTQPLDTRAIGEVAATPTRAGITAELTEPLTGFENHMGQTTLGPDARPLGKVTRGIGNGGGAQTARQGNGTAGSGAAGSGTSSSGAERVEGVVQGSVIATYMHGPALARNPQLADLLIARGLGITLEELGALEVPIVDKLRLERLKA
ncbi:glutamine amidotransferase [Corynebacterium sp. CNCTC7651]|uniref:type 1 glutamine amidotransferase n=1 Tax=Corynebacterium sp. CNCTC7651 TaxID=2815361 RepID=UPI001F18724D|nr:glutamine amidotransferase [Corynebacterium sp. CNCTC7651]UIZ93247.1 glutamine amidotransferase [Corynebacterium sp. CNCTC7651]UIZ93464.1 glutamine amidotransferase [Corynebacterium sp. CNCTC7651]